MRGKTVWAGAAGPVRDFQIRTMRMWGLRRTGGWGDEERSGSPTASTGEDARYAVRLWWMGGNWGVDCAWSGDSSGSDFHECGVRDRVCSESTEKAGCGGTVHGEARFSVSRRDQWARILRRRPMAKTASPVRMTARVESRTLATASGGLASSGDGDGGEHNGECCAGESKDGERDGDRSRRRAMAVGSAGRGE